jgi:DNA replication protein DnaC
MRTARARFPYRKPFESVDVGVQPSLERHQSPELAPCRVIDHGDKGVVRGPPGTGKTPLAVALGLTAIHQGQRPRFTSAMRLSATLTKASAENRLEERLKQDALPKRLISDEIGDIPLEQHGAPLVFPLIARRYARGAIILTANPSCGPWGEVVGHPIIATASWDRWLPHRGVSNSKGDASRLRQTPKAGLLRKPELPSVSSPGVGIFRASHGALFQ